MLNGYLETKTEQKSLHINLITLLTTNQQLHSMN